MKLTGHLGWWAAGAGAVGVVGGPALSGVPGQLSVLCYKRTRYNICTLNIIYNFYMQFKYQIKKKKYQQKISVAL